MARSAYIYIVTIHNTILWVGTVKHEMGSYLEGSRYDVDWLWVRRYKNGSQEGIVETFTKATVYLEEGKFE